MRGAPLLWRGAALLMAGASALAPPRARAILFDIDGTLFDSDPVHLRAFQKILVEENFNGGVEIDDVFFRERISGRQNKLICADLFPERDAEWSADFAERKEALFRSLAADALAPITGLSAFLARVDARGLGKAAVTNAPRANAEFMLKAIDRLDYFDALVIGDECARAKPDPEPYLVAARAIGVPIADCLVVEDSPSGAVAGAAAGALVIGMLSSQTPADLEDAGCSYLVGDFDELSALLEPPRGAAYYRGMVESPLDAAPADAMTSTLKLAGGAAAVLAALTGAFFAANA